MCNTLLKLNSSQALKEYSIPREKVVILTKCYGYVGEEPGTRGIMYGQKIAESKEYVNRGGLSKRAIVDNVNQSLKRLGVDYIDLLQIHRFDPHTPVEETMEALHDLVKSGKVGQAKSVDYTCADSWWRFSTSALLACGPTNSP